MKAHRLKLCLNQTEHFQVIVRIYQATCLNESHIQGQKNCSGPTRRILIISVAFKCQIHYDPLLFSICMYLTALIRKYADFHQIIKRPILHRAAAHYSGQAAVDLWFSLCSLAIIHNMETFLPQVTCRLCSHQSVVFTVFFSFFFF